MIYDATVTTLPESLYWTCQACRYKQLRSMECYCPTFEEMRSEWAANQNIATLSSMPRGLGGK